MTDEPVEPDSSAPVVPPLLLGTYNPKIDAKGRMASVGIQNLYREKYQVCDLPPNIENGDYADMAKNNLMARTAAHRAVCR